MGVEAFGIVLIVVSVTAFVVAALSFVGTGTIYQSLGRTGAFSMDRDSDAPSAPRGMTQPVGADPRTDPVAREEVRQMLEAKNVRRVARGQAPLDIDAEMETLLAPAPVRVDAELRAEVRVLVEMRNRRRVEKGQAPLDVDSEIERQLRDLGA